MKYFLFSILLLVSGTMCGCGTGGGRPAEQPPNIVLITLESLRADHVGSYGYPLPVTPNLDRFAREAIRFTDAQSVTSWTLTSHASLLTGLYPAAHQVLEPGDRLGDSYQTLAELLGEGEGYATAAFVSGPFLRTAFNLDQGFQLYDDSAASPGETAGHADVTNPSMEKKIVSYLRSKPASPFFLFAYFWDIHYDYIPPAPYDTLFVPAGAEKFDISQFEFNEAIHKGMSEERIRWVLSQYDGEIRSTDEMLGRILQVIREEGLWENTLIVITSDHGEEFFEHQQKGHKNNLHVESVHVPLLIKRAGSFSPGVDSTLVSLVDLFPTLIGGAADSLSPLLPGRSLFDEEGVSGRRGEVLFDLALPLQAVVDGEVVASRTDRWMAIRTDRYKYMKLPRREGERLFSLEGDKGERYDISQSYPEICDSLRKKLATLHSGMEEIAGTMDAGTKAELTAEERARLEALGYVQ